jgi:hypothetical protein
MSVQAGIWNVDGNRRRIQHLPEQRLEFLFINLYFLGHVLYSEDA